MKLMSMIFPLLISISTMFGYDSYVDLQFTADPYDLRGQTHLDICAPHVFYHEGGSLIVTPEVTSYVNSNTDIGLSVAKKFEYGSHTFGVHSFYDRSSLQGAAFHHVGGGISIGSERFEVTGNYYHPLTNLVYFEGDFYTPGALMKASKWADTEFLMKTKYFNVGTGPIYNFDYKEFALHSRLIIPTDKCQISIGGILSESGFTHAFLSVSFSLMKNPSSSSLSRPISRTKKSSISFQNIRWLDEGDIDTYNRQVENVITLPKNPLQTAYYN